MSRCLLSPSRFVLRGKKKTHTHTKSVGVFAPTSPNLSKHAGFQTIQSRAKETRQTGPGVMLSQQRVSDLKGKRGFVGNLHTRDFESFRGRLRAAGCRSFGYGWTIISLLDGLQSHVFLDWFFSNVYDFEGETERKIFAFAREDCAELVDNALTHLPPLSVARLHGVAQLENNCRSRPSGCSLYLMPVKAGVMQRPPQGLTQQQLTVERSYCCNKHIHTQTHADTQRDPRV